VPSSVEPSDVVAVARCIDVPQSDLPTDAYQRAVWLMVVAEVSAELSPAERGEEWARAVVRYVSRHYRGVHRAGAFQRRRWVESLRQSGRRISRRVPVAEALRQQELWWEDETRGGLGQGFVDALARAGVHGFPDPPFPSYASDELSLEPLLSPRDLFHEGRQMHHCVLTYTPEVLQGHCAVYRVIANGQRSTLMVQRDPSGGGSWRLGEHRAHSNADVDEPCVAAVGRWFDAVSRHGGPPTDGA